MSVISYQDYLAYHHVLEPRGHDFKIGTRKHGLESLMELVLKIAVRKLSKIVDKFVREAGYVSHNLMTSRRLNQNPSSVFKKCSDRLRSEYDTCANCH